MTESNCFPVFNFSYGNLNSYVWLGQDGAARVQACSQEGLPLSCEVRSSYFLGPHACALLTYVDLLPRSAESTALISSVFQSWPGLACIPAATHHETSFLLVPLLPVHGHRSAILIIPAFGPAMFLTIIVIPHSFPRLTPWGPAHVSTIVMKSGWSFSLPPCTAFAHWP